MARIVLTSYGSSGDINPFIALGLGLRARGHDVVFAVQEHAEPVVRASGFAVHPLPGTPASDLAPYAHVLFASRSPFRPIRLMLEQHLLPLLVPTADALLNACTGADALVSAAIQLAASVVADRTQLPWLSLTLTPASLPSRFVMPAAPVPPLPASVQPLVARAGWSVAQAIFRWVADRPVNRVRKRYGLPPRRDLMFTGNLSHTYSAVAVSRAWMPPPPDWPAWLHVTGFCLWDRPSDWHEPPELTTFLGGSRPAVAVSSGSMAAETADLFRQVILTSIRAIQRLGARALVIGAAPSIVAALPTDDVLALPFAPFSAVYPRCSAVIHHGGIGTLAQGLRAGVPALVVPWGFDQFFNGAQLQQVGAGRIMLRHRYTERRATEALGKLLESEEIRRNARRISEVMAREDGVATICDALEAMIS